MKKLINVILAASTLLLITGCGTAKPETEKPVDNNDQVVYFEDQTIDKLIAKDMNVAYYDGLSHIAFDLVNENAESLSYQQITINYYSEDKTLLYTTTESVGEIGAGETMSLYLYTDIDLTKAKTIDYEIN